MNWQGGNQIVGNDIDSLDYQASNIPALWAQTYCAALNKPRIRMKAWRRPNEDGWLHLKNMQALPNIPLGDRK